MRVRVTLAGWDPHDRMLLNLAGISGAAHVAALILFSVLPRFISPSAPPMHATIAEIVPASALGPLPGAAAPAPAPQGATPSQRAAAAKEAMRQEKTPPPPKKESPAPKREKAARPDPTTPPLPGAKAAREDPPPEPEPSGPPAASAPEKTGGAEAGAGGISFGSAGAGLPGGIPSIGSSAFPYDYYRAILVTLLQSHWRRPVTPEGLAAPISCRVAFTILKNGLVQEPRVVESSGNAALDQSAVRALYDSSPLPPLPAQYGHGSVGAEVVFELTPE